MFRAKWIFLALVFIFGGVFWYSEKLLYTPRDVLQSFTKEIPNVVEVAQEIKEATKKSDVSAPPPLRVKKTVSASILTRAGIIGQTNLQRKADGRAGFSENAKLNQAASLKVADMFSRQYFAHVSPTGESASYLVVRSEYKYLSVGENLALGNFSDDKDLVEAWMNSPGHRANILDAGFTEIGVAAERGIYEGEETWLAVQIFAKPLSACPQLDENLKLLIDSSEKQIDEFSKTASVLKAELEAENPKTKREVEEYNQKVAEYNNLVKSINSLIDEIKILISKYNTQVRDFNACAAL